MAVASPYASGDDTTATDSRSWSGERDSSSSPDTPSSPSTQESQALPPTPAHGIKKVPALPRNVENPVAEPPAQIFSRFGKSSRQTSPAVSPSVSHPPHDIFSPTPEHSPSLPSPGYKASSRNMTPRSPSDPSGGLGIDGYFGTRPGPPRHLNSSTSSKSRTNRSKAGTDPKHLNGPASAHPSNAPPSTSSTSSAGMRFLRRVASAPNTKALLTGGGLFGGGAKGEVRDTVPTPPMSTTRNGFLSPVHPDFEPGSSHLNRSQGSGASCLPFLSCP